jgi:hypothetical protein
MDEVDEEEVDLYAPFPPPPPIRVDWSLIGVMEKPLERRWWWQWWRKKPQSDQPGAA